MKKLLSLVLGALFICANTFSVAYAAGATLPNNTPVEIQLLEGIDSSSAQTGDSVKFKTVKSITLNGQTIIAAGSPVSATVIKAEKRKRIGRPGEIVVGDFSTVTTKGTKVPLTGDLSQSGKRKMTLSIVLSVVIIPLFLLMKGKDAVIEQGYQTTVYTAGAISQ